MNKKSFLRSICFIVVSLIFTTACGQASSTELALASPTSQRATPVEVATAKRGNIASVFNYSGNLNAEDDIQIIPQASGQITEILVDVGDEVKLGQTIALIDDQMLELGVKQATAALRVLTLEREKMLAGSRSEEIAAARSEVRLAAAAFEDTSSIDDNERTAAVLSLAQAQANLQQAQAEYDKIAWAGNVGETPQAVALEQATAAYEGALAQYNLQTNPSDATLAPLETALVQAQLKLVLTETPFRPVDMDIIQARIDQAQVGLEQASLQLSYATIEAPFSGVIAALPIEIGSLVDSETSVAHLISNEMKVDVSIEEERLPQVEVGQNASVQVTAYPGVTFPAIITEVSPIANTTSRTFKLTVTPQDEKGVLRSGMFADVTILGQQQAGTVIVPRSAVFDQDGQPTVYIVESSDTGHMAQQRSVTLGLTTADEIEIISGLNSGEQVVTLGQDRLMDGARVLLVAR